MQKPTDVNVCVISKQIMRETKNAVSKYRPLPLVLKPADHSTFHPSNPKQFGAQLRSIPVRLGQLHLRRATLFPQATNGSSVKVRNHQNLT